METVTIVWSGPYSVDSAIKKLRGKKDFGIYMITRKWVIPKSLLDIGLVYWRKFAERLAEHKRNWLRDLRGIRVRVGKIKLGRGKIHSFERTEDVECLLIRVHQPEFNVRCKSSYNGRELKIINLGRRGPLKKQIYSEDYRQAMQ